MSTRNNAFCCWFTLLHDIFPRPSTLCSRDCKSRRLRTERMDTISRTLWWRLLLFNVFQNRGTLIQRTRGFGSFQCRHSFVARETIPTAFSRRDESLQCLFFFFFQSNPRYGTTWHVSEEAIRGRQWEYSCTKKSFTTHKTSNEKERYLNDSKKCRRHVTDRSIHSSWWQWLQYQNKWYKSH